MTEFAFSYQTPDITHKGRLGKLITPHGTIETPAFIFCATKAAIKALTPDLMRQAGTQIILSNTYHLMLQPGPETVAKLGGLQKMTGWNGPMLTDSGGFQIFSLGHGSVAAEIKGKRNVDRNMSLLKITEEGALFSSYTDGSRQLLTPERSIQTQCLLGADLIVVFDECTPFHVEKSYTETSMRRSHRWALRSLTEFAKRSSGSQELYGIIQGGVYEDLRDESTDFVNEHSFWGHAIGGSLGSSKTQMYDVVAYTMSKLAPHRPVHLLGIGGVRDIFEGVLQGIDTFDCVHPTRLARHGGALIRHADWDQEGAFREHINLNNARFAHDPEPIDPHTTDPFLRQFSRGYVHHLLKAQEMLAQQIITYHNVKFMNTLMQNIRIALHDKSLAQLRKLYLGI